MNYEIHNRSKQFKRFSYVRFECLIIIQRKKNSGLPYGNSMTLLIKCPLCLRLPDLTMFYDINIDNDINILYIFFLLSKLFVHSSAVCL